MISSDSFAANSYSVPLLGEGQDSVAELFNDNGQSSEVNEGGHGPLRPSSLRMLLTKPTRTVHYYWRKFDDAFMRPVFGGRGFVPFVPGSPTEQNVQQWQGEAKQ